ncbi:DUF805 domain-containing protein [Salinicoccus sp. ID82-1]|uniref:DUF805 domain-containing protein n=1 Tax=Salinicoccus sp. ID82-1 TaxID=2820269 RepID=UPI001F3C00DA|nr:DUF805 domain-containing protein [Salinicoccus sp. ID82-1]MCG1010665.1 DUF805 domain-containing protein [Salinicoccus sp. ID82-1]
MFNYLIRFFKKSFQFSGRATRKEYWVPSIILAIVAALLPDRDRKGQVDGLFTALVMVPSFSLTARRYHDVGISGWYQLPQYLSFLLLPFVFMKFVRKWVKILVVVIIALVNIIGFAFTLLPSGSSNKYGPKPPQ